MSEHTQSGRAVDAVIQPVAATSAVREGEFHYYGYSAVANVLDYPAAVFPVTATDEQLDGPPQTQALSAVDEMVRNCCKSESPFARS